MKNKALLILSLLCFLAAHPAENAEISQKSVRFDYSPKFLDGRMIDCDIENNTLSKIFYVNAPEGEVKLHVGDAEWSICEEESGRNVRSVLYESEFVHAGKQRLLKIRIYPIKRMSGKTYALKKISIEVEFEKPLSYSSELNPLLSTSINKNYSFVKKIQVSENDIPFRSYLEIKIAENGIYKITYDDLVNAGIDPENLSLQSFALYSDRGVKLPIDSAEFMKYISPDKVPVKISGDTDRIFEKNEYILFFGESPGGYKKNYYAAYDLYNNPFTDYSHYMLVFNDKSPLNASNLVFSFKNDSADVFSRCVLHYDSINPLLSGYGWVWKKFSLFKDSGDVSYEYDFALPDLASDSGAITLSFFYQTDLNDTYDIDLYVNGELIGNMASRGAYQYNPKSFTFSIQNLSENNTVTLKAKNTDNRTKNFYLSESKVDYKADHNAPYDIMIEDADFRYLEFNPPQDIYVYVKDDDRHYLGKVEKDKIQSVDFQSGEKVFITKTIKTPRSVEWKDNSDIYSDKEGCDILVITGDGFKNAVLPYIQYRKSQNLDVKVFETDEIADGFSFGVLSPSGIKAFLNYGMENWKKFPAYLLLLGSGSYDYKNRQNIHENRNIVPVYETGYGVFEQALLSASRTQCVDRWYTLLSGNDQYIDMIPGRITAMSRDEAYYAMMKVIDYETKTPVYTKNKAMVISDDEYSSRLSSEFHDIGFMYDSENLAGLLGIYFGVKKLYLTDYWGDKQTSDHWQYDPGYKRDVRFEYKRMLDEGVAFGFFYGHGSYYTLTHEHVLLYPDDIDLFTNIYKYPIFLFGTCQAGQFDNDFGAIAPEFQKLPYSGFSASIASTRAIGSDESINILYYSFASDLIDGGYSTIGEYYLSMINTREITSTSHVLFGDPSMKIKKYKFDIAINSEDTINLGSYNDFQYTAPGTKEGNVIFDIYQPFYTDSHDYWHTIPYTYIYYGKSDGILGRINKSEETGSFTSYITDAFENKNYQFKMLITGVCEDDSTVHLGVRKPLYRYQSENAEEGGEIKFFLKNNEVKDSLILPQEYSLEVRFYSAKGIYFGNINMYKPSLSVKGEAVISDMNLMFETKNGCQSNTYKIESSQTYDTINAVIYDSDLTKFQKSIIVKHSAKQKSQSGFALFPNPFEEYFNISFTSGGAGTLKWKMIDEKGFTASSGEEMFQSGYNLLKIEPDGKILDRELKKGIYYFYADFKYYGKSEITRESRKAVKK